MYFFKKFYVETLAVVLVFITALTFGLIKFSNSTTEEQQVRTIAISQNEIDYQSFFESFYDVELIVEDNTIWFSGYKDIDASVMSLLDNVSVDDLEQANSSVKYDFNYDAEKNIMVLQATLQDENQNLVIDRVAGVPFLNENGDMDIAFNMDGQVILLSELSDTSVINQCGWLARLAKAALKVAVAAVVVAAVVAVVVVAAPVVVTASATVAVGAGTAALAGTAATAAIVAATATATTVATVAATTAAIAVAVAAVATIADTIVENQVIEYSSSKSATRAITTATIATISEITLERKYNFAYISGPTLNIVSSISFNYIEAYVLLLQTGLINSASKAGKLAEQVASMVLGEEFATFIETIKQNAGIKEGYAGFYTFAEQDAAKLAYAAGGLWQDKYQSETHDTTAGSGYYYHFHDYLHVIHVWYGNPA